MSWQLSRKTEDNVELYRLWSTIVDGWINDEWLTREQMMKFFFWQRFREFTEKYLEDFITFPNKYIDKNAGTRIFSKEKADAFNFIISKDEEYAIFDKLSEIITQQGIALKITDSEGYQFDSKEDESNNEVAPSIEEPVFTRENNPNYFKLLDLKNVKRWREEDNGKKKFDDYEIYAITAKDITISNWNGSHKMPMEENFEKYTCPAGKRVRVWMVSTQGDVGVTDNLVNPVGYGARVDADKDLKDYEFIDRTNETKA